MQSFISILALAALARAITITNPNKDSLWDSSKSNTIEWTSVNTDPTNVDIYLSHMSGQPPLNDLLFSNVAISDGKATVSGLQLPTGDAYQINFVAHDKPEQIYAQSNQFNVTGNAVQATSTLAGYTGPTATPSSSASASASSASGASETTLTGSSTASTATGSTTLATSTGTSTATTTGASSSGSGTATNASSSASASPTKNAAPAVVASAPLAALMFGAVAMFI